MWLQPLWPPESSTVCLQTEPIHSQPAAAKGTSQDPDSWHRTGCTIGRAFERWCHTDFDKATIEDDIAALQRAGRDGVIALVHAGEPCTAAALSLGLAAYLIGAGANSYFACSDGWTVTAGWEPEDRWAEYDYPLGEPTGPALRRLRTTVKGGGERVWWFNTNATSQAGAGQRT
eukprot:m.398892 g.398892  ORF g.398892 m.398892 type:complete len:174 (+) comp28375_c1_seq8:4605-5126(+)